MDNALKVIKPPQIEGGQKHLSEGNNECNTRYGTDINSRIFFLPPTGIQYALQEYDFPVSAVYLLTER